MSAIPSISRLTLALLLAGILALIVLSFWPVLDNDFVNFDDTKYVTLNPFIKELTPASVKAIFTSLRGLQYHYVPLSLLSFAVEYKFFKLDPHIYHLDNLILHVFNAALLFAFMWFLARSWLLAAMVALLFGIHPMHVESVAWIAERKDVLYTFFFLIALIQYLFYVQTKSRRFYGLALVFFIFSCLAKPMAITFSCVLLCLDYYFERLKNPMTYIEKIPFFIGSAFFAFLTSTGKYFGSIEYDEGFAWSERFLIASYTFLQYVLKAFFPIRLSTFYPYPIRNAQGMLPPSYYWAPVLALLLVVLFVYAFRHRRLIMFGGLFFFVSIFPVLNFYPLGNMLMAERYSYVSYIGLFIVVAQGLCAALEHPKFNRDFKLSLIVISLAFMAFFSNRTFHRVDVWQNSEMMWNDAIFKFPKEPFAYYNLADYYFIVGKLNTAIQEYSNAISVDPRYFAAYNNRGNMYLVQGQYDLALQDYLKAIEINPRHITSYMNTGDFYMFFKQYDKAVAIYDRLLSIDPQNKEAQEKRMTSLNLLQDINNAP